MAASIQSDGTQQGHGISALPRQPPRPKAFLYKATASATAHGRWERTDFTSAWENPVNIPQQHPPSGGRTHRSAAGLVKCFPASLLKQTQRTNEPQNACYLPSFTPSTSLIPAASQPPGFPRNTTDARQCWYSSGRGAKVTESTGPAAAGALITSELRRRNEKRGGGGWERSVLKATGNEASQEE